MDSVLFAECRCLFYTSASTEHILIFVNTHFDFFSELPLFFLVELTVFLLVGGVGNR